MKEWLSYVMTLVVIGSIISVVSGQTSPSNLLVSEGDTALLRCHYPSSTDLDWYEYVTDSDGRKVAAENVFFITDTRYTITGDADDWEYNWQIADVTGSSDGGRYACKPTTSGHEYTYYAELVVTASDVTCTYSISTGELGVTFTDPTTIAMGDSVFITCNVDVYGNIYPEIVCSGNTFESVNISDTSTPPTVEYVNELFSLGGANTATISCVASFPSDVSISEDDDANYLYYADNVPSYSDSYSLPTFTVIYPPEDVIIQPIQDEYENGATITCSSSGTPEPSYHWLSSGDVIAETNALVLDDTSSIEYTVKCVASSTIGLETYTAMSEEVDIIIKQPLPWWIYVAAGAGAVVIAVVIAVAVVCHKKKLKMKRVMDSGSEVSQDVDGESTNSISPQHIGSTTSLHSSLVKPRII